MLRVFCVLALSLPSLINVAWSAPTNFVGVNAHQPANDVLDGAKDLGVSWVRIDFNWFQAQPAAGTAPDFSFFDKMINEAQKRGLKVFPTIGYGPAWASEPDTDGKPHNNAPKSGEYEKFCKAVATHYNGKLTHLGLWNEPNLGDFFDGTKQQWIDRIAIEGIKGIKAGCPTCKVLGPELASIGDQHAVWLGDSLKQLKQKGLMYDIITWHIYGGFLETKPGWACWSGDLFEHDLDKRRVCFGLPVGQVPVREVLLQNGLGNLPVWITETGATAPVGDAAATAKQVTYYRRVLEEQLKRKWWTHTFFYEIVDDNNIADKWGMAVRNGTSYPASYQKKPVWAFMQKVLGQQPAFGGGGSDCSDGLDNDGDKLIDYPGDTGCSGASDPTETPGVVTPDAGTPDAALIDAATDLPPVPSWDLWGQDTATPTTDAARRDGPAPNTDAGIPAEEDDGCGCDVGRRKTTGSALALVILCLVVSVRTAGRCRARRPAARHSGRRPDAGR